MQDPFRQHFVPGKPEFFFQDGRCPVGVLRLQRDIVAAAGLQFGGGDLLHHPPTADDPIGSGDLFQFPQQMAADHDGHAPFRLQLQKQTADIPDAFRVQAVGRLVQQEQVGVAQQRQGQPQPPSLPHGKPLARLAARAGQAHFTQGPLHRLRTVVQPERHRLEHTVFPGRQPRVDPGVLHQHPQPPPDRGIGQRAAEQFDLPGRGAGQPGQQLEGGGFSGAVLADKSVNFSFSHLHVQVVHGRPAPVPFAQPGGMYSHLHTCHPPFLVGARQAPPLRSRCRMFPCAFVPATALSYKRRVKQTPRKV